MLVRIINWLRSLGLATLLVSFVAMSIIIGTALVSVMSLAFHGRITHDFLITGWVVTSLTSAIVVSMILYFVKHLRTAEHALSQAREELEARVLERTEELSKVNDELRHEIAEREHAEAEHLEMESKVQQSQKMEAVGRLAGGVAHDFNNVLCVIKGNTTLALDDLCDDDPLRELLDEVSESAERAAQLTRQLLAFSRKQVMEPKVINLSDLIESLHSMLVRLIGEDIILRTVPEERLGRVLVDPGQIEQVVLNLAINARDAMPDGGELVITVANAVLEKDYCRKHERATPGANVLLEVTDTGCGMSAEIGEKVFEPFFTTKEQGKGTGLGLATVLGIVEQSSGSIEVISEPNKGTTFRIHFPQVVGEAKPRVRSEIPAALGGQETVLVVEDEEMVRNLAVKLLTRLGYEVIAADSGGNALVLAERHQGPIHLLLTDVVMPHMDGHELATRLTELRPETKVLYTSGYTQDVIAHRGVLDEGMQFVAKPYDTLAIRVREVLDDL